MGRPQKPIDPKQVEMLAIIGCKVSEMAAVLDCDRHTLERRFGTIIEKGREKAKTSLRRWKWESARRGNVAMQIFLGKQILGKRQAGAILPKRVLPRS